MGYGKKVDSNHGYIVQGLKALRFSVCDLSGVGQGVPDLIVGYRGVNVLVEIKSNRKNGLTFSQKEWHRTWQGSVIVAHELYEILITFANLIENEHDRAWLLRKAAQYEANSIGRPKGQRQDDGGYDISHYAEGDIQ